MLLTGSCLNKVNNFLWDCRLNCTCKLIIKINIFKYFKIIFQPPIDPMQLLNCLKVLLNEDTGGLKGPTEAMQISR